MKTSVCIELIRSPNTRVLLARPDAWVQVLLLGIMLLMLSACAHYPVNPKLESIDAVLHKKERMLTGSRQASEELLLILAFSGGGTRAAALSFGVLEALHRLELPYAGKESKTSTSGGEKHTLLDEVDMISSVSGGSFTAAYYGLYGDRIFKDYKERFLTRQVQRGLLMRVLFSPPNWFRLMSSKFGKSDLAAEYYDKILFDGATFGDIREQGPIIRIQATDLADGFSFGFTDPQFAFICSDLEKYPVSRAVAASAAFPGPFTPIILQNYTGQCGFEEPQWVKQALINRNTTSREYHTAKNIHAYLDPKTKQFIHLLDGGISDNLGVRGPTETFSLMGSAEDVMEEMNIEQTRHVAMIVVNASTPKKYKWGLLSSIPGLGDIIGLTSNVMLQSYNFETMDLLRRELKQLEQESMGLGDNRKPIQTYLIEVGFDALPDRAEQMEFADIPTALQLPEDTVDRLRKVAGRILYSSEQFKKLVTDLGGKIPDNNQERVK
jgi:NTE family protein